MSNTQKQDNASDDILLLHQLEEIESSGQIGHIVFECGALTGGCPFPREVDKPSE